MAYYSVITRNQVMNTTKEVNDKNIMNVKKQKKQPKIILLHLYEIFRRGEFVR